MNCHLSTRFQEPCVPVRGLAILKRKLGRLAGEPPDWAKLSDCDLKPQNGA